MGSQERVWSLELKIILNICWSYSFNPRKSFEGKGFTILWRSGKERGREITKTKWEKAKERREKECFNYISVCVDSTVVFGQHDGNVC